MSKLEKVFQWLTLIFFSVALYSMTLGQYIPIEFTNWRHSHIYYDIILAGLPVATLFTLVWTIRKANSKKRNILIGIATILVTFGMFILSIYFLFVFGFGAWVNEEILYENKQNPKQIISQQLLDIGAFGYGGQRTVKLTPFLGLWNITTEIDTTKIEKNDWTLVKKEGDIKFP